MPDGPGTAFRWLGALVGSLALALAACGGPIGAPAPTPPASGPPPPSSVDSPPEWRPGDQWVYAWSSRAESGTKIVEMVEVREVNGVPFYIVRFGGLDHFYTRDLHWAGTMRDQKVETRMVPPQPWFVWPLEAGRRWTHRGTYEERESKRQHISSFAVVGPEVVEVPAGRFTALKVVREGGQDTDEYWYAPEVRFYARWVGRRADARFEEQLREYRPAPRLIPPPGPTGPPSGTR